MESPLVSICCISYNHERFIRKALEGFVNQKTSFPFEIVISDDCSSDGTRAIITEYASKYPEIFRDVSPKENLGVSRNFIHVQKEAKGKYVAFCEGDDYWTDAQKLQKQVDFLESHPDYSVTFHRCKHYNVETGETKDDECGRLFAKGEKGVDIDLDTYFSNWYTQPLTMVYRAECLDMDEMSRYKYYRDMHEIYHLLKNGKGYVFSFFGGMRTLHPGGVASMISNEKYCDISLPMDGEFYWKTRDKGPKKTYMETLDACVRAYSKTHKWKAFHCAIVKFAISGHPRGFITHLKIIFGK